MGEEAGNSFESIESAQEFVELLAQTIGEARGEIQAQIEELRDAGGGARRREALQLVAYKLETLSHHMAVSRRLLNDLRTLRRLLLEERPPSNRPPALDGGTRA
jgi:predicted nuclease of restriction endonuclease-like RecB superfamily